MALIAGVDALIAASGTTDAVTADWTHSILAAQLQLQELCEKCAPHKDEPAKESLAEGLLPVGVAMHFTTATMCSADRAMAMPGSSPSTVLSTVLRLRAGEVISRWATNKASTESASENPHAPHGIASSLMPLRENLSLLADLNAEFREWCSASFAELSLDATAVHQHLAASLVLRPRTSAELAAGFYSARISAAKLIVASYQASAPAGSASGASATASPAAGSSQMVAASLEALTALHQLLASAHHARLPLLNAACKGENGDACGGAATGYETDPISLLQRSSEPSDIHLPSQCQSTPLPLIPVSRVASGDAPQVLPPNLPAVSHQTPSPWTTSAPPVPLPESTSKAAHGFDMLKAAVQRETQAALMDATRSGHLPKLLCLLGEHNSAQLQHVPVQDNRAAMKAVVATRIAAGGTGGTISREAGSRGEKVAAWTAVLGPSIDGAIDAALRDAASTSPPFTPLLASYLSACRDCSVHADGGRNPTSVGYLSAHSISVLCSGRHQGGRAAVGASCSATWSSSVSALELSHLRWWDAGDVHSLPLWHATPRAVRAFSDSLGMVAEGAKRLCELKPAAISNSGGDDAGFGHSMYGECMPSGISPRPSLAFATTFLRPIVAMLEAALPVTGGNHASRDGELSDRVGEATALAAWLACKALTHQLARACSLAFGVLSASALAVAKDSNKRGDGGIYACPFPHDAEELRRALEAAASQALRGWASSLSLRSIRHLVTTSNPTVASSSSFSTDPTRVHWHAVPMDTGASSAPGCSTPNAKIPLPYRPSDQTVRHIWRLLRELRLASAAPLHASALSVLADEANRALVGELSDAVGRATRYVGLHQSGVIPDHVTQLLFDVRYLERTLGTAIREHRGQADLDGHSFTSLQASLTTLSKKVDPICQLLVERPLHNAVDTSVATLGTLFHPVAAAPPRSGVHHLASSDIACAAVGSRAVRAATQGGGGIRLPVACARFSSLPVQTSALQLANLPTEASSTDGVTAARESAFAERAGGAADVGDGRSFASGMLSKVGGAFSSARVTGTNGVTGRMTVALAGKLDGLSSTGIGDRVLGGLGLRAGKIHSADGQEPKK